MQYSKSCIVTSTVCYNVEDAVFRAAGRTAETDVVTAVGEDLYWFGKRTVGDAVTMAVRNAMWVKPFTGHPGLQDFLRSCGAAHEV